ncbi:unnamed protein product [Rotaria sordida]|uniref:Cation-transporting P-type ATPase N-terminal domain-containing protein n=1 Tax=Rotaria sordida TaxID=392033 RepID=A0A815QQ53_9BILA|nr:unnamed protein product [Rotaria sordida]
MTKEKKSTTIDNDFSSEDARHRSGISIQELEKLMQTRDHEGIKQLNDIYDGLSDIEQKLKTNLITDLSNDETDLSIRIAAFGRNEILQKPSTTFLCLLFDALKNWTCITLIICGIISFVLLFYHPNGETIEAKIKPKETNVEWIEDRQSRNFQSLVELDKKCNVIRESTVQQIPIKDIVVGDICEIKYGDVLPADDVIIQSNNLKVDESSLTGESDLIEKHESTDPFLPSGK